MEFYIRKNDSWVAQPIVIAPELTTTFDETLDEFNCTLPITDDATPIEQDTLCKVVIDNNVYLFIVAVDTVNQVSKCEQKYQHELTLVQNTRLLSKHLVRNTVFSQPARKYENSWSYTDDGIFSESNILTYATLDYKRKIDSKCKFSIKFTMMQTHTDLAYNDYKFTSLKDFVWRNSTSETWHEFADTDYVYINVVYNYYDGGGSSKVITLQAKDIEFEKEIEIPFDYELQHIKKIAIYVSYTGNYKIKPKDSIVSEYSINSWCLHLFGKFQTYYYTMYDVIDTLLKQQAQDSKYYENEKLFKMPDEDSELGELLLSTIAPNFSFSGTTFYDCLSEIFKFYDATFTIDENNVLDIEFLNEYHDTINKDFSDKLISIREDEYNQGLINTFENALVEQEINILPKADGLGTLQDQSEWGFSLPNDIQEILSFELYIPDVSSGTMKKKGFYFDFTNFVVEQAIYSSLEVPAVRNTPTTNKYQHTCFPYSGNKIQLGINFKRWNWGGDQPLKYWFFRNFLELIFIPRTANVADTYARSVEYSQMKARIRYVAQTGGRIKVENNMPRYKGELQVNQSQGRVDTEKLGMNILGLSTKMGNPTLSLTQKHCVWGERIKKGDIYTYNNENWVANVVKYVFYNDFIQTNVEFVKNYNALSSRVQVDREKRLSNISNELVIKAEENYVEYIYVYAGTLITEPQREDFSIYTTALYSFIAATFGKDFNYSTNIDFVSIDTFYDNLRENTSSVYVPTIKYGAGNTVCIECSYNSPISAGNSTEFKASSGGYTSSVLYSDEAGWADYITINFNSFTKNSFSYKHPVVLDNEKIAMGEIVQYHFYKKPNEIFAFNYQVTFLPLSQRNLYIGNEFITKNGIVRGLNTAKLYICYSGSEKYSMFDKKAKGAMVAITSMNVSTTRNDNLHITFKGDGLWEYDSVSSCAICDENRNIYIAINGKQGLPGQRVPISLGLTFIPKHNRIN